MIYLACPYTHPDPSIVRKRFEYVTRATGCLMKRGLVVFSPITQSHLVAEMEDMPGTWEFWAEQDLAVLKRCDALYVLCLPGWKESVGVTAEIKAADDLGLPVFYLTSFDLDSHLHNLRTYGL